METSDKRRSELVELVQFCYGDFFDKSVRSLDFLTDELTTDEFEIVSALLPSYNAFDGREVGRALMPYRGRIAHYKFGRAGSPVLQVSFPFWTHQREGTKPGTQGVRIPEAETRSLMDEMILMFKTTLHADEADRIGGKQNSIYAWWD